MDIGKIINHISPAVSVPDHRKYIQRSESEAHREILNFILVESALHPVYQKDIEKEFSLRPPTVTEMLKSLEARELILRIPDEQDGRFKRIVFTSCCREGRAEQRDPRDGRTAFAWNLRKRIEGICTNNRKNAAESGADIAASAVQI